MCDYRTKYFDLEQNGEVEYVCPHCVYETQDEHGQNFCLFHYKNPNKDHKLFYQEFSRLINRNQYLFPGFVFPVGFDFQNLKAGMRELKFLNVVFKDAIFFCTVNFNDSKFHGDGITSFENAEFIGEGSISFNKVEFYGNNSNSRTSFEGALFSSNGTISFNDADFSSRHGTSFSNTRFKSKQGISFNGAKFFCEDNAEISFKDARFLGKGRTSFELASFKVHGKTSFEGAWFLSKDGVSFAGARFFEKGRTSFEETKFGGKKVVSFFETKFLGDGGTTFGKAVFSGNSEVIFQSAIFSGKGGVSFFSAQFLKEKNKRPTKDILFIRTEFKCDGEVEFDYAQLTRKGSISFSDVRFSIKQRISFFETRFSSDKSTSFDLAEFSGEGGVFFEKTGFSGEGRTIFRKATFSSDGGSHFIKTQFRSESGTSFDKSTFSGMGKTSFEDAEFSSDIETSFNGTHFMSKGDVLFSGKTFTENTKVDFRNLTIGESGKVIFQYIDLSKCQFLDTNLEVINFKEVYWANERYKSKWNWKIKKIADDMFQSGTIINRKGDHKHYQVYELYNQLIRNYESTYRHQEAGDFFAGRMDMRRRGKIDHNRFNWIMLHLYKIVSEYGERPLRALMWVLFFFLLFGFIYSQIGLVYPYHSTRSAISNFGNGLMVSLDVLIFGKLDPLYKMFRYPFVPLVKGIQLILNAILIPVFLLAMNRKFRRTKD